MAEGGDMNSTDVPFWAGDLADAGSLSLAACSPVVADPCPLLEEKT